MKKIMIAGVCLLFAVVGCLVCKNNENKTETGYLRVHIRANSNNEIDQGVKYEVKAAVVDYLTPKLVNGTTFQEAYDIINQNLDNIENVADKVLTENGFDYASTAKLKDEYFPTRSYGEYTLENGYYDALIINLGAGNGDNWWCVVYPPICFIGAEGNVGGNIKYKSKLLEIVKNFFN